MSQSLYDPTRVIAVVECPYLPGPRFEVNAQGITEAERLVSEPVVDKRNADIHPRATARTMVSKLLRIAHNNAVSRFHGMRTKADVAELRDPTDAEAAQVRVRLAGEPDLATLCRKVAELRGILAWLDRLDTRDGITPKAAPAGANFPGVSQAGNVLGGMRFTPVGIR